MYIVFEATYGGYSDIKSLGRDSATFECKWDNAKSFAHCGRFNILRSVSPGVHSVEYKAGNAVGESLDQPSIFTWCVSSCMNTPITYHPIRITDVNSYISGIPNVSFYSGKNETITLEDLKKFPILKEKIGPDDTYVTEAGTENTLQDKVTTSNTQSGNEIDTSTQTTGKTGMKGDSAGTSEDGETRDTGEDSTISEETALTEKQKTTESGTKDDTSSEIEKNPTSMQDDKASCGVGETFIPGEGCAPS